jgi:hypothetical protein
MFKASVLGLAVLLALIAAPPAHARHATEWSSAKHTTHHRYVRHRAAQPRYGYGQPGYGPQGGGQQQGETVCRGDAIRLCKPVLGQGNMAVLGCFRSHVGRLSRGCRALLQSYGQI